MHLKFCSFRRFSLTFKTRSIDDANDSHAHCKRQRVWIRFRFVAVGYIFFLSFANSICVVILYFAANFGIDSAWLFEVKVRTVPICIAYNAFCCCVLFIKIIPNNEEMHETRRWVDSSCFNSLSGDPLSLCLTWGTQKNNGNKTRSTNIYGSKNKCGTHRFDWHKSAKERELLWPRIGSPSWLYNAL